MSIKYYLLEAKEDINRLNSCLSSLINRLDVENKNKNDVDLNFLVILDECFRIAHDIHAHTGSQRINCIANELKEKRNQWQQHKTGIRVENMSNI